MEFHSKESLFLTVPYVVRVKILSQLTLHEQLVLRIVCKTFKEWIDASSLVQHVPVTIIEDHGSKTFSTFLTKRPPHLVTHCYVQNDSDVIFHDVAVQQFLDMYAKSITKLHMGVFFTCQTNKEMEFYEKFENLVELKIDKISISIRSDVMTSFPSIFKNLKKLTIDKVMAFPEPPNDQYGATLIPLSKQRPMGLYVWDLIEYCDKIEHLGYPNTSRYFFQAFVDGRGRGEFGVFHDLVRRRGSQNCLQCCDFENDKWDPDSKNALALLKLGNDFGIRYLHVNANQFQYLKIGSLIKMYDLPPNIGDCIGSFKNFNCLITDQLNCMERLGMIASDVNTMLDYTCVFNGPRTFPNLKEIEIIIDVGLDRMKNDERVTSSFNGNTRKFRDVQILLSHFFFDMEMILMDEDCDKQIRIYENVQRLAIKFPDLENSTLTKATFQDLPLDWIIIGLPNLRRLEITGWNPPKDFSTSLWRRFARLEELILDKKSLSASTCSDYKCFNTLQDKVLHFRPHNTYEE